MTSPQEYSDALAGSVLQNQAAKANDLAANPIYTGNNYDLGAVLAAAAGTLTLISCCGGFYCLPPLVLLLGTVVFLKARSAVAPRRTQILAGVGVGSVLAVVLFGLACAGLYVGMIFLTFVVNGSP